MEKKPIFNERTEDFILEGGPVAAPNVPETSTFTL